MTDKQTLIDRIRANVPSELLQLDQWVLWRQRKVNGRWTKVPYQVDGAHKAEVDDPATWVSFEAAAQAYLDGKFSGLGFVFTEHDPYTGIDLDKCIADGIMDAGKLAMLLSLDSYAERSQSGTGAHCIVRGRLPIAGTGKRNDRLGVEMYHERRFFVMTGDRIEGTPATVNERQEQLTALFHQVFGKQKTTTTPAAGGRAIGDDAEILHRMFASKHGAEIERLWNGDKSKYADNPSNADQALVNHLVYWCDGDKAAVDRLFRQSALMREKWERDDYREMTIGKALASYTPRQMPVADVLAAINGDGDPLEWARAHMAAIAGLNGDAKQVYAALREKGVKESDVVDLIEDADQAKRRRPLSERIAEDLQAWGYDFWLNDLDDSIRTGTERMTDPLKATLRMQARDSGNYSGRNKIQLSALDDAVLAIAAANRRHPLREYLSGLQWDGEDHIGALAGYFTDEHEPLCYRDGTQRTVFHAFLLRWLAGSVAKIHGDQNAARANTVLTLLSKQGSGKSHFASKLCPLPDHFVEKIVKPDEKDAGLLRAQTWVWEIAELGATTRRADTEALKGFITATTVTERRAYGHYEVVKPCIASYIGSVNDDGAGFLNDPTGNRRFAIVEIEAIDWDYDGAVDMAQVWAQAMTIWRSDPRAWRYSPEEVAVRDRHAERHTAPDMMADALARMCRIDPATITTGVSASQILRHLHDMGGFPRGNENTQGKALAAALKKHWGITQRRSNGSTVYDGVVLLEATPAPVEGL